MGVKRWPPILGDAIEMMHISMQSSILFLNKELKTS